MSTVLVEYKGYIQPVTPPDNVFLKWRDTLYDRRALIYERIHTKIPDITSFITYLATPAYEQWKEFVNPYWFKADVASLKHAIRVRAGAPRFLQHVYEAFQPGATFQKRVLERADRFRTMVAYPLGNVGIRYYMGWGPGYKAVGCITGDKRVKQYITAEETFTGEPVIALDPEVIVFLRPTLIAELTLGATFAQYAHEIGATDLRDAIISEINDKLSRIISAHKKPDLNVVLQLGFDPDKNKVYVYAKVEKVA